MRLPDVNVLVYAHWEQAPRHADFARWLVELIDSDEAFGMSDIVLSGFVRVITNPRIFSPPMLVDAAIGRATAMRNRDNCVTIQPGARHWDVFTRLCLGAEVKGNLVADAYLAAMAIESGCEWMTTDRDFARFAGLRWRHPLDP